VAMLFVIFDIEIIFLYPYVLVYRELALAGFVAIAIFAALVFESFVYLISKGALDWGPSATTRQVDPTLVSAERTASTTIRKVGLEGRLPAPTSEVTV